MKLSSAILVASVGANFALGWVLCRPADSSQRESTAPAAAVNAAGSDEKKAKRARDDIGLLSSALPTTPAEIRDWLRVLGFSEEFVRAAVKAQIEAPRLARQRAIARDGSIQPWWRVDPNTPTLTGEQLGELRQLRLAERANLNNLFGLIGSLTREDIEPYAFLSEEKASHVATIRRDLLEWRDEVPPPTAAPVTAAEAQQRGKSLQAEWDRQIAALLTPEEFEEFQLRTSTSAHSVGNNAKYFSGTADEFRALYETDKMLRAATEEPDILSSLGLQARIAAMEKRRQELVAVLGPERYVEWKRASEYEYQAIVQLQRRFPQPPATITALAAVPRQISEEAIAAVQEPRLSDEEKLAKLRALANDGRERVRVILGSDLGDAYNDASARGWLDELNQGRIPMYQPNGERATFMAVRRTIMMPGRSNSPGPVRNPSSDGSNRP